MATSKIARAEEAMIESLMDVYERQMSHIALFKDQLLMALSNATRLTQHIHSIRSRIKDPARLKDKIARKLLRSKAKATAFDLTPDNLLIKVNDLAGVRVLHLYTRQIREIDKALREIFAESQYELLEGPFARTWDDESRQFFRDCGIETQESPSMYTSVHYVIGSASRTKVEVDPKNWTGT